MKILKYKEYFTLLILSLIPLIAFLHPGLPVTHDGQDHVARIANFYTNLEQGNIIPRWAPNLNWGYGHPILMFLYPLPSYIASLFHFVGLSYIDSAKLTFMFAYIASGVTMFLWIKEFLGKYAGFVAAMLYLFAPYRFVDMYVRGAIGEHMAFVFLPLILYFFSRLSKKYSTSSMLGGIFAVFCLLLSHNAISLMFFPILFLYILFLAKSIAKKRKFLITSFLTIFLGFMLSSFFWFPALIEGKYTLRDIVTAGGYIGRFVHVNDLFYGQWSYGGSGQFTVQVGLLHWIVVGSSIFALIFLRKRIKHAALLLGFLVIFFLSLLIMLDSSSFIWRELTILQKFQFPWRFLTISVFASSVLGGFVASLVKQKHAFAMVVIVAVILFFLTHMYWVANGYFSRSDVFYNKVYLGTTDTGESAPIWSVRFMENAPRAAIEVIGGYGETHMLERKALTHTYLVDAKNRVRLRENTLYFPGWIVFIDNNKLLDSEVEQQDPANRGLITFFVPEGKHKVVIQFTETKLRLFADFLSMATIIVLVFFVLLRKNRLWQRYLSY